MKKWLWITWEKQRRSVELAQRLGCSLAVFEHDGFGRYALCMLETLRMIRNRKPIVLFVQNPSMVLSFLACVYGRLTKTVVVVDRHSNFMLTNDRRSILYKALFRILNYFTLKFADLTIVTNKYIADVVKKFGGRPFILPDKIPDLKQNRELRLGGKFNLLMICSFGKDEPVEQAIEAMEAFKKEDVYLYVTGNYRKMNQSIINRAPSNVIFTGFLDEQDFVDMLFSVNAVMVLTTIENCMLCGCYEAFAACKPLITSRKKVLEEYFKGAVFVDNSVREIREAIDMLRGNIDGFTQQIKNNQLLLKREWDRLFYSLRDQIIH